MGLWEVMVGVLGVRAGGRKNREMQIGTKRYAYNGFVNTSRRMRCLGGLELS